MSWEPNLSNVPQRIPTKMILRESAKKLQKFKHAGAPREILKDSHGEYGFRFGHFIFLAKDYIYGNIISCHKFAVVEALKHELPIVIYLNDTGNFYEFQAKEILMNSEENRKGTAIMLNFNVSLGKRKFENVI